MVKDSQLFFLGDDYVFASWLNTSTNESYYAFFRDLTEDGITNFVVTEVTGPWKSFDEEDSVVFDPQYDDAYLNTMKRVEVLLDALNKDKDLNWEGTTQSN